MRPCRIGLSRVGPLSETSASGLRLGRVRQVPGEEPDREHHGHERRGSEAPQRLLPHVPCVVVRSEVLNSRRRIRQPAPEGAGQSALSFRRVEAAGAPVPWRASPAGPMRQIPAA